jgi:hypothetical protein
MFGKRTPENVDRTSYPCNLNRVSIDPAAKQFLVECWHVTQRVLAVIGATSVARFIHWLWTRRRENFEDKVLKTFQPKRNPSPWRTTEQIQNEFRGDAVGDIPMWVILPVPGQPRWGRFKWRLKSAPYRVRHFWRKRFVPSLAKVEKTVLHLWKRNLLMRDAQQSNHYRLRP